MQPLTPVSPNATRDQYLWQLARRRAKFQGHLLVYLLVNTGLWALYFLTLNDYSGHYLRSGHYELPWPIWSTAFWGFGVLSQGLSAYAGLNRGSRTQREYERLLAQQGQY